MRAAINDLLLSLAAQAEDEASLAALLILSNELNPGHQTHPVQTAAAPFIPAQTADAIAARVNEHFQLADSREHLDYTLAEASDALSYPEEESQRLDGALRDAFTELSHALRNPDRVPERMQRLRHMHCGVQMTAQCYRRLYASAPEHDIADRMIHLSHRAIIVYDAAIAALMLHHMDQPEAEVRLTVRAGLAVAYRTTIDQRTGIDMWPTIKHHANAIAASRESSGSIDGVIDAVEALQGEEPFRIDARALDAPLRHHVASMTGDNEEAPPPNSTPTSRRPTLVSPGSPSHRIH